MDDYIEVKFKFSPENEVECDILSAFLGSAGYESFAPIAGGIAAYIKKKNYSGVVIKAAIEEYDFKSQITWEAALIEGKDWNEEWEKSSFTPIEIAGQCIIHSTDSKDYNKLPIDITINPRMSFGSGHHATTRVMAEELLAMEIAGKNVADVGTGTGILAIIASKKGAKQITAIEIDDFAYENATENFRLNNCENIEAIHGDAKALEGREGQFDLLIANINRNIILADINRYATALKHGGTMLLSGFFDEDTEMITAAGKKEGLEFSEKKHNEEWTLLKLEKKG
jgi:ribosomal protein L11 methyltransferase